ncbi:hypothetical protein [Fluviicola taffensis]|uniref:Uncharacterized protein n=1 Tax=Fluviicola taffensis (strain DSM 16823 / NCIMB 13979 / RW262) TaxID=755732 RepID=F2IAV2_FLUTR|nr:hypothetical protein [Fluviicola taffensis]AEA45276.1 hypothetical protein Fluta_3304 [Fluviicola taffensis DSM 16823]
MKIAFLSLFLLGSGTTLLATTALNRTNSSYDINNKKKIHIDITLTSKNGCKFHIVGNYNSWTGNFTGNVYASGKNGCPEGTFTFGLAVHDDGTSEMFGSRAIIGVFQSDRDMLEDFVAYLQLM